jgi:hypothetical protein
MRHRTRFALLASLVALSMTSVASVFAEDPPPPPKLPKGMSIGDTAPAFEATDLDGKAFALASARAIKPEDALAAVNAAAKAAGSKSDLKRENSLENVPGLKADASLDAAKVAALANAAGKAYGLIATAESVAAWKTVGDVATWVESAAEAPIVFLCWSSKCPTSKLNEERIIATIAKSNARLYCLACSYYDPDDDIRGYIAGKELPFHVLLDHDQKITDVLGGRHTPHAFVLDAKDVLRYCGAIDSDAEGSEAEEKRIPYLASALTAIKDGDAVGILMTTPVG